MSENDYRLTRYLIQFCELRVLVANGAPVSIFQLSAASGFAYSTTWRDLNSHPLLTLKRRSPNSPLRMVARNV